MPGARLNHAQCYWKEESSTADHSLTNENLENHCNDFPEFCANLISTLATLHMNELTHFERRQETRYALKLKNRLTK